MKPLLQTLLSRLSRWYENDSNLWILVRGAIAAMVLIVLLLIFPGNISLPRALVLLVPVLLTLHALKVKNSSRPRR